MDEWEINAFLRRPPVQGSSQGLCARLCDGYQGSKYKTEMAFTVLTALEKLDIK